MNIASNKIDFFVTGGTLRPNAPSYVERPSDNELFKLVLASEFCYVLTPRQMGKSSLMIRTAKRLREEGSRTVIIDLTNIGLVTIDKWYLGLLTELTRELRLSVEPEAWWQVRASLGQVQRFTSFIRDVVLAEIREQIVIFVDEIDTTLNFEFRDDFFAAIRSLYNARARDPIFNRLTFVFLGVASPADLIKDRTRTPFNIGQGIKLKDFRQVDASVLQAGLEREYPDQAELIFSRIYYWTNGHPYLTQKLCHEVEKAKYDQWTNGKVDALVQRIFLSEEARKETNIQFVQDMILTNPQRDQLLDIYRRVLKGKKIDDNEQSPDQNQLKLAGLVKAESGNLIVRNEIYRQVFNLKWIRTNSERDRSRMVARAAVSVTTLVLILLVGFVSYLYLISFNIPSKATELERDFLRATTSEERLTSLAALFELQGPFGVPNYADDARQLFFGLSGENQLALFNKPNDKIIIVVRKLYVTFVDINNTNSTAPLLQAMVSALGVLEQTKETTALKSEIETWLRGRTLVGQNRYEEALTEYNQAITINLNGNNPATLFERARILTRLSQYQAALNDLDQVMAIASKSMSPTPTPGLTPTVSTTTVLATLSTIGTPTVTIPIATRPISDLFTLMPTTTSLLETTATSTGTRSLLVTATSTSSSAPRESATPTPTRLPVTIVSDFDTTIEIISAVRQLIDSDSELVNTLRNSSSSEYSNLREFGLIPMPLPPVTETPSATPSLTPISTVVATSTSAIPVLETLTSTAVAPGTSTIPILKETPTTTPKVVTISFTQEPSILNPLYTNQWFSWITTALWLERPWNFDENAQAYAVQLTELPSVDNGGISKDGLTMAFKLKDGLTWSDGEPFTSADWVFTWQMYTSDKNAVNTRYPYDEFVDNVTAPDPLTVEVKLKKPFPAWQSALFVKANGGSIIPKHILEPVFEKEGSIDNAEWNRAPTVGIGPFVFKEWETSRHFSFVRNDKYYGTKAKIDEVFFRILPDDAAQNVALKAGDADIGTFISFADIPDLKKDGINIMSASSGYNEGWFLNMRPESAHPAMLDLSVRKALALGVNREQITQDLLFGLTQPNVTFWDGSAWVNPDLKPYPYDPEEAKKLLDEAGWVDSNGDDTRDKDGKELVLRYVTTPRPVRKDTQAVVQQQLAEIGIGVELFNFEGDVFFAGYAEDGLVAIGESDFAQWSNVASFPDPDTTIWLCDQIPSNTNSTGDNYFTCDQELDKLLQEQTVTVDPIRRRDLLYQIEQLIYDKVYYIGMWQDPDFWAVNSRLTNVKFSGVNPFFNAVEWDIKQ